jgi:acetyl esterase/lipase
MIKLVLAVAAFSLACPAAAQTLEVAERAPDASSIVALYPGNAPGSESWPQREQVAPPVGSMGRFVRNVRQPTLTIFKPVNPARAARTAVIIAPGGAFRMLSIDTEGYDVARYLAARGVTAVVLKYRLDRTPDDPAEFERQTAAMMATMRAGSAPANGERRALPAIPPLNPSTRPGVADGLAAVAYIRQHAAELNVAPDRIGLMGFSAGGGVTLGALQNYDAVSRPNFAGIIYMGAGPDTQWKPDTPPVFAAVAADDFVSELSIHLLTSLRKAKVPIEFHLYNKGGHGFGMQQLGQTTDLWIEQFASWMGSLGYLSAQK